MRGNGGPSRRIRRRTALKSITGTTAAAVGIATATTISASGPEGVAVSPEETTVPNPDVEYRVIDKSVKRITAKYPLLTLEEDTVLTFINDSGLPSDRRSEAADAARKLRRMYPTTEKQEGNVIRVTLAEESNDRTERTRHLVDRAFKAFRMGAVDR
jgi:hypothetical protein